MSSNKMMDVMLYDHTTFLKWVEHVHMHILNRRLFLHILGAKSKARTVSRIMDFNYFQVKRNFMLRIYHITLIMQMTTTSHHVKKGFF